MNNPKITEESQHNLYTPPEYCSPAFLLQMLNGISDPIFVKNRQHRWVLLNDAFCRFMGLAREQLIGKSDYDFFGQAEADVFWEIDELVFTTGINNEYQEDFTDASGITHIISTKKSLFFDPAGNKFLVGTIRDITQYRQVESQLQHSKQLLLEKDNIPQQIISARQIAQQRLSLQNSVNRVLAEATSTQAAIPKLLQAICENLNWDLGEIWILDPQTNHLRYVNNWHSPDIDLREFEAVTKEITFPCGVGLPGKTQFTNQPIWIDDVTSDTGFLRGAIAAKIGLHSAFGIPIKNADSTVGAIAIFSRELRQKDPQLLEMVGAIGNQLGQFIARQQAESALAVAYAQMETLVTERTKALRAEIAQHEQTEAALRESQAKLQKLAANVPGMLFEFVLQPDGSRSLPYVSWGSYEIYELTPEQIQANVNLIISFIHPDDRQDYQESVAVSAQTLQPFQWEGRAVLASGEVKWVKALSRPEKQRNNAIVWHGVLLDVTERKQAEEALKESESKYRQLVETSQDVIWATDSQGRFTFINQATRHIYGYEPEEMIGRPFADFVCPEQIQKDQHVHQRLLAGESVFQHETVHITKDGKLVNLLFNAIALQDSEGNVLGTTGTASDITERKTAEKALQRSNAVLKAQQEAAIDGILIIDENLQILSYNQRFADIWQIPLSVIETGDDQKILALAVEKTSNPEEFFAKVQYLYQHPEESSRDEIILKDGRTLDRYSAPVRSLRGDYYGRIWYFRDITQKKRAEAELKASQQRLALLIQQTPLAVIEWNTNFEVQEWNPAAERMFGYTKDEALGRSFDFLVPEDAKQHVHGVVAALLSQQGGSSSINENITKNGRKIICEWHNSPLIAENGKLIGVASMVLDITERKQAEEELQKFVALIENSSDFIGIADKGYQVQYVNPAGLKLVGLSSLESARSHTVADLHPPEEAEKISQQIIPLLAQQNSWQGELYLKHSATSNLIPTDCIIFEVKHPETGEPFCRVAVARDITERKKADEALRKSEAQLRQQAKELEQALEQLQRTQIQLVQSEKMSSLGQLVAGIAHEINNPVNFIYGNLSHAEAYINDLLQLLQLYQKNYPQPVSEIQDFVEEIELDFLKSDLPQILDSMKVGAERIREIVLSLRTFSRLDEAEMKAVDIHEGIDSTLMILEHRFKKTETRPAIQVIKEYSDLPKVQCYPGQLNQVFINILTNAIDATEQKTGDSLLRTGNNSQSPTGEPVPQTLVRIREASRREASPTGEDSLTLHYRDPDRLGAASLKGEDGGWSHRIANPEFFTPQIRIRTQLIEANQVTISIADNGTGISEDVKQRVFDPFFTTKPVGKGTGLGLSISYQIIAQRHGGCLQCISTGQGAEFIITIPLVQSKV